jgi:ribosomal protein L5
LEKANANSTSALSKIAEVEKNVAALRAEMENNNQEIQKSLTNLVALLEKLVGGQEPPARVARTAVPTFTVRKEDEARGNKPAEGEKSVHDLLKQALQNPQRASAYLR